MMKAKETSSRHRQFTARHGDNVFELEAVPPARLQAMLRQTIDSVMNVEAFNAEVQTEKDDAAYLEGVRRKMHAALEAATKESMGRCQYVPNSSVPMHPEQSGLPFPQ
jgi:hypothetical protein